MKLPCEIVQDLLPLYEDAVCSKESQEAVEAHLRECPSCRSQLQRIQSFPEQELSIPIPSENPALVHSFRKIRRRWLTSLLAVLLVLPVILLSVNQARGAGICYTNADEIFTAGKFVHTLEKEDFQSASEMMNYEDVYQQIQEALGRSQEDFLPHFVPVTIGQEEWMAQEKIYETYWSTEQPEHQFWNTILYEHTNFLIPLDIWNEMVSQDPDSFLDLGGEVILTQESVDFGEPYVPMETPWGTYMVRQSYASSGYASAADLCAAVGLVPVEIYQEGIAELEKSMTETYENTQKRYAEVSQMTLGEFCERMQERRRQKLEEYKNAGYSFQTIGYETSVYDKAQENWYITYGLEVTYQGETCPVSVTLQVSHGEILQISMNRNPYFPDGILLDEALSMYYIP